MTRRGRSMDADRPAVAGLRAAPAGIVLLSALVVVAASLWVFWPVTAHGFLNWDDPDVVAANEALQPPLAQVAGWAFSTRDTGHYQPLSWLVYAALASPVSARAVHTASVVLHAVNALLLFALIRHLLPRDVEDERRSWIALAAATLFAVHPLRLEPVAWASALPYLLSYGPLLGAVTAWISWARTGASRPYWIAIVLFALSQLARVTAPLLPLALVAVARVVPGAPVRPLPVLVRAALPFGLLAVPLGIAEATARAPESLADVGVAPRIAWMLIHPVQYLWRHVVPGPLNPLDPLPRYAVANWDVAIVALLASVAIVLVTAFAWSRRVAVAVWGTYALLLLPVVGVLPSGLQLTADRYTYGPAMVLAVGVAALMARVRGLGAHRLALVILGAAAAALGQAARAEAPYWRDSVTLWTRSVELDAANDVALYNLGLAQAEAGQPDAAIDTLDRLLALVPDHDLGRDRRNGLLADRDERRGIASARLGEWNEAVAAFDRVLTLDPTRVGLRANRGMARLQLGRLEGAADDLAAAVDAGRTEPALMSALAYAWSSIGRTADALELLERARVEHPSDQTLQGNLARLLVTAEPPSLRAPERALALAAALNDATGGRDVRVLDTLALALAATGRARDAADALDVAIGLAEDAGDRGLVADMTARRRALGR